MKMFSQVSIPNAQKNSEYVVTAQINKVLNDEREGPFYFIQETNKGGAQRVQKVDFKNGKYYHHSLVKSLD